MPTGSHEQWNARPATFVSGLSPRLERISVNTCLPAQTWSGMTTSRTRREADVPTPA
jgi:hypothetical protein